MWLGWAVSCWACCKIWNVMNDVWGFWLSGKKNVIMVHSEPRKALKYCRIHGRIIHHKPETRRGEISQRLDLHIVTDYSAGGRPDGQQPDLFTWLVWVRLRTKFEKPGARNLRGQMGLRKTWSSRGKRVRVYHTPYELT